VISRRWTEEFMRFDHLEALVHERRRVDRDLRAPRPGGMSERIIDRDRFEISTAPPAKWPTTRRENQPIDSGRTVFVTRPQTLMVRGVIAVDRDQFGTRRLPRRLDDRSPSNQRFLVRERQAPS